MGNPHLRGVLLRYITESLVSELRIGCAGRTVEDAFYFLWLNPNLEAAIKRITVI